MDQAPDCPFELLRDIKTHANALWEKMGNAEKLDLDALLIIETNARELMTRQMEWNIKSNV